MTRASVAALLLAAALLVAGCGDDTPDDPGPDAGGWTVSGDPVDTSLPAWADGSTVHLGEDTTIEAEETLERFVVAGDGIYFVPAASDDGELLHASADGVEGTGAYADPDTLRASPDGRYLAFVDRTTGDEDEFGTPVAVAVVVDLEQGEEVLRSDADMGDLDTDLTDLYEDAGDPDILGITDDTVWVFTPGDVHAVDLATGDDTVLPGDTVGDETQPWYAERYRGEGRWNPGRTWAIDDSPTEDRFAAADGARVTPRTGTPTWSLFRWLDDATALGFAVDAEPTADGTIDPDAASTLITCTVPDGACTPIPATTGVDVVLPTDSLR